MTQFAARSAPAADADLASAFLEGLSLPQKTLPCRFFYDAEGSALFEHITDQPEYYPTRIETSILEACASEIAARTPPGSVLVEFGSGSSRKTEILLKSVSSLAAYVPIDVSLSALDEARERLATRFPALRVHAIEGNFSQNITLPANLAGRPRLWFFPGSTMGNFAPAEAALFLARMGRNIAIGGRLVIGVDLRKDEARLTQAYNDAAGFTARFNLNLLARANREIGANFDLDGFAHEAIFNGEESRIEMYLVSLAAQSVSIDGHCFDFVEGERIHTENSYKYTVESFQALAASAGWSSREVWTDAENLFSVHELAI